jgi:hypothetical protein
VRADDVQVDRCVSELAKSTERDAEALARPRDGNEQQLERPRAKVAGRRGVEGGVNDRGINRCHARDMLEHGWRPREHAVGRVDKSLRVCNPRLGGHEPATWIQPRVGWNPLVPEHAGQVESLCRLGLTGAVLAEAENPGHEPKKHAVNVGDAE